MRPCPVCGQNVVIERLQSHVRKVHPREKVDIEFDKEEQKEIKEAKKAYKPSTAPKGKWLIIVALLVIIAVILAFVLVPRGLRVGDVPPGLELRDQYNNPWNLEDRKGAQRCVLLEFFHPECPACQWMANNTLVPFYDRHSIEVEMVSIAITWSHSGWHNPPDYGDIDTFRKNHPGTDWTFLADQGTTAKETYQVEETIPKCYLIGKDWKIAYIHEGTMEYSDFEAAIVPFL